MSKTLSDYHSKNGIIRFLLLIYAICIIYMALYMLYKLYKFIRFLFKYPELIFKRKKWYTQLDETNFVPYALTDRIAYYAFLVALCIFCALSAVFLVLYLIYVGARKIGMDWLLLAIFKPFRDCKKVGLFDVFDRIFELIGGSAALIDVFVAYGNFLENFFQDAIDMIAPGNSVNKNYLDAFYEYTSGKCTDERKREIVDMMAKEYPIIKVTYVEDDIAIAQKNGSYMDITELNNCIKYNTVKEKGDEGTIDTLKIILTNELAKDKCMSDFKRKTVDTARRTSNALTGTMNDLGDVIMQEEFL